MTDWLSIFERGLKAVRYGIFQASDNLAMLLDGFCRAPEDSAAGSPQNAAVVAPSPKQGSDSGPADSDILTSPAGPHPNSVTCARDWNRGWNSCLEAYGIKPGTPVKDPRK